MRERRRFPADRRVTGLTRCCELGKGMIRIGRRLIVGPVARVTFPGRAFENLIRVARNAGNRLVRSCQREAGKVVVKSSAPLSIVHFVARAAVC